MALKKSHHPDAQDTLWHWAKTHIALMCQQWPCWYLTTKCDVHADVLCVITTEVI